MNWIFILTTGLVSVMIATLLFGVGSWAQPGEVKILGFIQLLTTDDKTFDLRLLLADNDRINGRAFLSAHRQVEEKLEQVGKFSFPDQGFQIAAGLYKALNLYTKVRTHSNSAVLELNLALLAMAYFQVELNRLSQNRQELAPWGEQIRYALNAADQLLQQDERPTTGTRRYHSKVRNHYNTLKELERYYG